MKNDKASKYGMMYGAGLHFYCALAKNSTTISVTYIHRMRYCILKRHQRQESNQEDIRSHNVYVYGSGYGTAAVLLPGFAIN